MKIAITGSSGFLGRHLVADLAQERECEILAFTTNKELLNAAHRIDSPSDLNYVESGAIRDAGILAEVDVLINCAFPRGSDPSGLADGLRYVAEAIAACARDEVPAVVNISSQSVYSQKRTEAASEASPIELDSPYATAKYASELMLESAVGSQRFINLRLASLIGVGFDQRVVNRLIKSAIEDGAIRIAGGDRVFDFMDVRDASRAIIQVVKSKMWLSYSQLNVGSNSPASLTEIADLVVSEVKEQNGLDLVLTTEPLSGTTPATTLDAARLVRATGFVPEYSLRDTARDIIVSDRRSGAHNVCAPSTETDATSSTRGTSS